MTTYQFIKITFNDETLKRAIRAGVVSVRIPLYLQIYEYWRDHGRSESATAEAFKLSRSNIGYIIRQMKRNIQ